MPQIIKVIDSLGREENFSEHKILRSLKRAGTPREKAKQVLNYIRPRLYSGITTTEIFKILKQELDKVNPGAALRFNLKIAMRALGPDGFSFEKYIKEVFESHGYAVKINQYLPGRCLSYETDLVAEKDNIVYFGECKYRNHAGERIDLSVALKFFATFMDVSLVGFKDQIKQGKKIIPLIITNTKFTSQAIKYCECQGIKLLGWNYPKNNGLERIIEEKKLYPITILPSFRQYMNLPFGNAGIMLASELINLKDIKNFSQRIGLPLNKIIELSKQAEMLHNEKNLVKKK
ncbi:MAG: ATP cone domain-containing protein [Candidatus Paceibacterota bacterium]|jgi:Holliday junction resolvase